MAKESNEKKDQSKAKEKKDDILNIVKQFIDFFEETDRSKENGDSV